MGFQCSLQYITFKLHNVHFRVEDKAALESRQYYHIAHDVREDITEQPTILIGGKLKEYQVSCNCCSPNNSVIGDVEQLVCRMVHCMG